MFANAIDSSRKKYNTELSYSSVLHRSNFKRWC